MPKPAEHTASLMEEARARQPPSKPCAGGHEATEMNLTSGPQAIQHGPRSEFNGADPRLQSVARGDGGDDGFRH